MSPTVAAVVALATLALLALASLELTNPEWKYLRGSGLIVHRNPQKRSRWIVGLNVSVIALVGAIPQLILIAAVLDVSQSIASRAIAGSEIVIAIIWVAYLRLRTTRRKDT